MHSQPGTREKPSASNFSSAYFSHKSPASGCPYKLTWRGTTGSLILRHPAGMRCLPRSRIFWGSDTHVSGMVPMPSSRPASESFTCVYAPTASLSWPIFPGIRAMASTNFVPAIAVLEVPCSENTAYCPSCCFTQSPRKTTRPLYL